MWELVIEKSYLHFVLAFWRYVLVGHVLDLLGYDKGTVSGPTGGDMGQVLARQEC